MTRIAVWPSDKGGVGWYRMLLPAHTLAAKGASVGALDGIPMRVQARERVGVAIPEGEDLGFDVLVIQRPTAPWQLVLVRDMQWRGVRVVVDVDDDFHAAGPWNPAWRQTHPRAGTGESREVLREACRLADLVTVSSQALAERYGSHGRVVVLPNYVPLAWATVSVPCRELKVVGWSGTLGTHRGDLAVTRGGVAQAVREGRARFRVIGQPAGVQEELGLEEPPETVEWMPLDKYPLALGQLGVGIAPLADNAFNRAKSWLKPLEMAALGVPVVMSPTDEYKRLHQFGIGVLARWRAREWRREVGRLLSDGALSDELSARGRQVVRDELCIEKQAWRWLEAWSG